MAKKNDSPISYETLYHDRTGKQVSYRTKTLTDFHKHLRDTDPAAYTCQLDASVKWPFGIYSEVIEPSKQMIEKDAARRAKYEANLKIIEKPTPRHAPVHTTRRAPKKVK